MTAFTPGQTLTLTLDYDDYVMFSGAGNMTVTPYTGSAWQTYLTGNQVIGPFKTQSTTVVIACTSDGTYTQQSQVGAAQPVYWNGTLTGFVDPATGQVLSAYGQKSVTVGAGGNYPDIQTAITALGSRITSRTSQTTVVTATNGSPTVTLGAWPTGNVLWVGDLWKPDSGTRYYKIKALNSTAKTITLWENFAGTTISGVSTAWSSYYLDRISLFLLPGSLASNGAVMQPGFDLVGLNQHGMAVAEESSFPAYPITNFGENNIIGIGFAAVPAWGDLDKMVGPINPNLWGGADSFIENCYIQNADLNGVHSGGYLAYPIQAGGRITYRNTVFRSSRSPVSVISAYAAGAGAVTPTVSNTIVNFDEGCRFEGVIDNESYTGQFFPGAICADAPATYNFIAPTIAIDDRAMSSFIGNAAGILVGDPVGRGGSVGTGTINIHSPMIRVANTGTLVANGIEVTTAATVNIDGADVEAAGTTSTGLYVNNASATVNIRGGCRFKGATNSLNNVAGTVNKSSSQPPILIGAAAGVITALDT